MKKHLIPALLTVILCSIALLLFIKPQLNTPDLFTMGESVDTEKDEIVVIHFTHWVDFPEEIFKGFSEKYPNIKVEFEQYDISQYRDAQRTRMVSGENIDVMGITDNDYSSFINKGYLQELTDKKLIDNFTPNSIQALRSTFLNSKIYAVPYKSWVLGIWYNKILFDKYNISLPRNYDEFLLACEKFKEYGISPMVLGGRDEDISGYLYYMSIWGVQEQDKDWFKKLNEGKVKWTDLEMQNTFKRAEDFVKNGYLSEKSIGLTYHQAFSSFVSGQAAMCLMGDWSIDMYETGNEKVCNFGVFPIPYNNPGEFTKVPGTKAGCLMGITTSSEHKEEAELLLGYLSSTENAQNYVDNTLSVCNVNNVNTNGLKLNDLWEPLRQREPLTPISTVLDYDMQKMLNKSAKYLMIGSKTSKQVLEELQVLQNQVNDRKNK